MNNYIIGAGGFAKEVYFMLLKNNIKCDGFIDIDKKIIKVNNKIFETIEESYLNSHESKNNNYYIGIGNPQIIQKLKKFLNKLNFPNLIDKNTVITGNVNFGFGNIVCSNVVMTCDINIGNFNIFNLSSTVGHDVLIGDCNVFNPTTCISGNTVIGNNNLFGVNSTILEKIKIKNDIIIGANALVNKNIEDAGIYIGLPAKRKV